MDTLEEHQPKRMQSGEADTIGEQQAEADAVWSDHARLETLTLTSEMLASTQDVRVGGCARLTQTWLRR